MLQFALTAFVTLLVVVDPFGVVPIFTALTMASDDGQRQGILRRAILIAFGVALFFLIAGRSALKHLGVTVDAFAISGGILLFATALPMLFGQRGGLQAPNREEEAKAGEDISIYPLAIPLLCGPGTVATILLLASQTNGDLRRLLLLAGVVAVVFLVAFVVLRVGRLLVARIGEGGVHIVTRVMGIILAALAVQYVLNGITGYFHTLRT